VYVTSLIGPFKREVLIGHLLLLFEFSLHISMGSARGSQTGALVVSLDEIQLKMVAEMAENR